MLPRLFLLALILFCLELGVFLVVLPWTSLWEFNYFRFRYPALAPYLLNYYLRGIISGVGLVDIGVGLWYAAHFHALLEKWPEAAPAPPPGGESLTRGQTA